MYSLKILPLNYIFYILIFYYLNKDDSIYMIFRGTSNLANWILDLETTHSSYSYPECSGCSVHSGKFIILNLSKLYFHI